MLTIKLIFQNACIKRPISNYANIYNIQNGQNFQLLQTAQNAENVGRFENVENPLMPIRRLLDSLSGKSNFEWSKVIKWDETLLFQCVFKCIHYSECNSWYFIDRWAESSQDTSKYPNLDDMLKNTLN